MSSYDAVVVGARCAGAPLAMLLARAGRSVLLVDRARFPSDTMSAGLVLRPGIELLAQWGLLPELVASGCPPITRIGVETATTRLSGTPVDAGGVALTFAPRRTVLDGLLIDGARAAGVEVREGFSVREVVVEDGVVRGVRGQYGDGPVVTARARIVIGADGRGSTIARAVRAPLVEDRGALAATSFGYWSGVPVDGAHAHVRGRMVASMWPTNDGLTVVSLTFPRADFTAHREAAERNYLRWLRRVPAIADRLGTGRREGRLHTAAGLRNLFRRAHGPGWALAGDAGHHKDPVTAQGISDALTDASALAAAVHAGLDGVTSMDEALAGYESRRDAARRAMFEFTCRVASTRPFDTDRLLRAVAAHRDRTGEFVSALAGAEPAAGFLAPDHLAGLTGHSGLSGAGSGHR
ncbi:NAD(P)/FAD-dependent oxidoreductase [Saccharopolyspora taberi]|uniref:NAD(P)/FAD-dependent oxidoreductase n=1 Tax=Saccharopolyspora taberi TaxID=60895 RepID=A0ABN3VDX0_9PSEU